MTLLAVAAAPTVYACPMHPDVAVQTPGKCPECGMKLLPAALIDETAGDRHEHHDHAAADGIQ